MTKHLPPNLLALFQARAPIDYLEPISVRKSAPLSGIASFLDGFETPEEHVEYLSSLPPATPVTKKERKELKKKIHQQRLEEAKESFNPKEYSGDAITSDAYKTLFVARISYATSESDLKAEFEDYGPIEKIVMVKDSKSKNPRGYAFIEFEHEDDMRRAYKRADGRKIDGVRVVVDFERGRTVKGWYPRRLGGGLGSTRLGEKKKPAPPPPPSRYGGGRGGGYGGGRRGGGYGGYRGGRGRGGYGGGYGGGRSGGGGSYGGGRSGGYRGGGGRPRETGSNTIPLGTRGDGSSYGGDGRDHRSRSSSDRDDHYRGGGGDGYHSRKRYRDDDRGGYDDRDSSRRRRDRYSSRDRSRSRERDRRY